MLDLFKAATRSIENTDLDKPLINYVAEFHIYYSMYRALSTGIRPNRIVQQMFDARRMVVAFNDTYT